MAVVGTWDWHEEEKGGAEVELEQGYRKHTPSSQGEEGPAWRKCCPATAVLKRLRAADSKLHVILFSKNHVSCLVK